VLKVVLFDPNLSRETRGVERQAEVVADEGSRERRGVLFERHGGRGHESETVWRQIPSNVRD
jgi:hypothetical protein